MRGPNDDGGGDVYTDDGGGDVNVDNVICDFFLTDVFIVA